PYGHGWHLDRSAFDRDLQMHAEYEGALIWRAAQVSSARLADGLSWCVAIRKDARVVNVRAKHIVDASGRKAAMARRFGAKRIVFNKMVAVITLYQSNEYVLGDQVDRQTIVESASG